MNNELIFKNECFESLLLRNGNKFSEIGKADVNQLGISKPAMNGF